MARPTKLTLELLDKAKGYLATCVDEPVISPKGGMLYVDVNLPSKVGLAIYLGIDKTTVDDWCKDNTIELGVYKEDEISTLLEIDILLHLEFSSIVSDIMKEQEKRLINNGLGGLYKEKTNAMLLSKHGYTTEKTETDITSGGEKLNSPILPEIIAEADRLLKERKLKENDEGN